MTANSIAIDMNFPPSTSLKSTPFCSESH